MRVTVIGAGIAGVCTAWSLADCGCEVTVIERNRGVAQEASHGNAGLVAPGYAAPWAAPGMPARVASTLFSRHAPIRIPSNVDPALWRWSVRWLGECRAVRYRRNRERLHRLAVYGHDVLTGLRQAHGIAYERTEGLLLLMRSAQDVAMAGPTLAFLKEAGVACRSMSTAECRVREPGLSDIEFAGGLLLPGDEAGNCPLFARHLKNLCEERGVRFEFGTSAERIVLEGDGVELRLRTAYGEERRRPDAVIVAAGLSSAALLRPLGVRLPFQAVKSYAASVTIREPTFAPIAAVVDEAYKVAIVRMGNRIRIAGTAELGDRTPTVESRVAERAFATLLKVARDWFPGAADYQGASWWVGARPMLVDGPPVIGATRHPRVFVNLGHDANGWATAPGAGRVVADLVMRQTPEIDLEGLTAARYG